MMTAVHDSALQLQQKLVSVARLEASDFSPVHCSLFCSFSSKNYHYKSVVRESRPKIHSKMYTFFLVRQGPLNDRK